MNLVLDFGNTFTKIAVFSYDKIIFSEKVNNNPIFLISSLFKKFPEIKRCIISSVADHPRELADFIKTKLELCIELDSSTELPVINLYKTPDSLGYDRIAGIIGANSLFPEKNILVIDAGTAITFDFINKNAEFTGGNISPGIQMRAKALNKYSKRLPLINPKPVNSLFGKSTLSSLQSGIYNGILFEIDGYIDQLKKSFPDLIVFLTGGDHIFFDKKLKNHIFVDSKLNLKGLNRILNHNAIK